MIEIINIILASGLVGVISYHRGLKKGRIQGEFETLRDAAINACIANHPAGGVQRHLKVVKE